MSKRRSRKQIVEDRRAFAFGVAAFAANMQRVVPPEWIANEVKWLEGYDRAASRSPMLDIQDDLADEPEPDTSDIPEQGPEFFASAVLNRRKATRKNTNSDRSTVEVVFVDGTVAKYSISASPHIARYLGESIGRTGSLTLIDGNVSRCIPAAQLRMFTVMPEQAD